LGAYTSSKARKVAKLNSFRFNKELGKIIQHKIIKLPIARVAPLSVTIDTTIVENIKDDPLSIALVSVAFIQASEQNLRHMMQEIEEYNERIITLEEEV
jgi:hypothetical protein